MHTIKYVCSFRTNSTQLRTYVVHMISTIDIRLSILSIFVNMTYILLMYFISCTQAEFVYRSSYLPSMQIVDVGLELDQTMTKIEVNSKSGLTLCGKFNYKVLGYLSRLYSIGCAHKTAGDCIWARMEYKRSFMGFGAFNTIVKDPETDEFMIWRTNQWHQICLAFDAELLKLTFVKVILLCKNF